MTRKVEIKYEQHWRGDSFIRIDGKDVLKGEGADIGYLENIALGCDPGSHLAKLTLTFGVYPDELEFQGVLDVFPELKDSVRFYRARVGFWARLWWKLAGDRLARRRVHRYFAKATPANYDATKPEPKPVKVSVHVAPTMADALKMLDYRDEPGPGDLDFRPTSPIAECPVCGKVAQDCNCVFTEPKSAEAETRQFKGGKLVGQQPARMVLHCPSCGEIHIDADGWESIPHKTHLCAHCKHEWRPHDFPTVGVYP